MHPFVGAPLSSVLLAMLFARFSYAAPWASPAKHATHRVRNIGRDLKIEAYHPKSSFKIYGKGTESPSFKVKGSDLKVSMASFIASELGVDSSAIGYHSGRSEDVMSYWYGKQYHDGVPFANAVVNAAFRNGEAVTLGSSFVDIANIASSSPSVSVDSIIGKVEDSFVATYNGISSLEYLVQSDGSIALTHVVQVQNEETNAWYEAFVDAHSGEILSVTDFVAQATYTVVPITKASVAEGEETLVNPEDFDSSPEGWVQNGETAGNNVIAYKGTQSATTSESSPDTFDYPYNLTIGPTEGGNLDAIRTNAFYIINKVHDFAYKYGWTEASYNFQTDNFGKGGAQGDRVLMSVQDASGTNNANFATPPDGQSGTCRMYIWTLTTPNRDGGVQNDIVVHEFTHGITNRLTGGGTGRCLQTTEASGMGEGWSDAMAEWTEQKSGNITDFVTGTWVVDSPAGVRTYPYSTDPSVNPLRYSSLATLQEIHAIGEVWANMLHNVYAALVEEHGWSSTAMEDPSGAEGNIVYLHLFMDALSLQPCNPTFVAARDAWIQADVNRYNGTNGCILWKAFASRGLGVNAANYEDDGMVPDGC
ncbi:Fungalysin metallopeptidase-domain-containing protein [Armillaria borealis]|uniref:Extracellular metalloproteinase n=1 Tax=Armillaria borealis TaxID=47425 RepID=A0AA39MMG8_9AGAR|nr:Fungalysin metallopeptidase-domain-containing protein [Armillaria borealis]